MVCIRHDNPSISDVGEFFDISNGFWGTISVGTLR